MAETDPAAVARLLKPRSVAIVGASDDPRSIGGNVLGNLERAGFAGELHLVSRTKAEISGRPCVASIDDLPPGLDAVVPIHSRRRTGAEADRLLEGGPGRVIALDSLELRAVSIPMRHRFRRVDRRDVLLVRGPSGWGEFSPFAEYPPEVTHRWLAAALELAHGDLPAPGRETVEINVTIPTVDGETAAGIVRTSGARTAKVKVGEPGQSAEEDLERLRAVAQALGDGGRIRIDANAAWDLDTATRYLSAMESFDIEYAEQPVATVEEMVELRRRVTVPLAADELIRQRPNPLRVVEEGGADYVIVKVQPLGGVAPTLDLAARAGVPVVVSSALETSVGMYGGLLAASLIEPPTACGLNTVSLLGGDVTTDSLVAEEGKIRVRRPEPDPGLLERWAADDETTAELVRRLREAARLFQ